MSESERGCGGARRGWSAGKGRRRRRRGGERELRRSSSLQAHRVSSTACSSSVAVPSSSNGESCSSQARRGRRRPAIEALVTVSSSSFAPSHRRLPLSTRDAHELIPHAPSRRQLDSLGAALAVHLSSPAHLSFPPRLVSSARPAPRTPPAAVHRHAYPHHPPSHPSNQRRPPSPSSAVVPTPAATAPPPRSLALRPRPLGSASDQLNSSPHPLPLDRPRPDDRNMGCGGSKDAQREADYQTAVRERKKEEEKVIARCVSLLTVSLA